MQLNDYLFYPAILEKEGDAYNVAVKNDGSSSACCDTYYTCGENLEDALFMAQDVILAMSDSLIKDRQKVPSGKVEVKEATHIITLKCHQALKIMLRNAMLEERYRPVDICKKMGISSQKLNQILDLYKNTNLEDLYSIFKVIGRPLQITC